jgi:hypothetical protein
VWLSMVLAKAQNSIALRMTLPHRFQGDLPIWIAQAKTAFDRHAGSVRRARITDHDVIVRTGPNELVAHRCSDLAFGECFGRDGILSGPPLPVLPPPPG